MGLSRVEALRPSSIVLYIQSEAHQGVAAHLGALNPYTLRKYWACGSDLAQHGRDRIDQGAAICSRMASLQRGLG
jgi:hypothetical protein